MDSLTFLGGGFAILMTFLMILIAVVWILLPFAVFGIKQRLNTIIMEARRTNKYLSRLNEVMRKPAGEPGQIHEIEE